MQVIINASPTATACVTLSELLSELGYEGKTVATAVDGVFVARALRSSTILSEGMCIDIVAPVQGG